MVHNVCFLSVVVPTLNESLNIGRTLRYIRCTDPLAELIVVDGGSTDGTVEIAKKYANKVIVKKSKTIGAARNVGAKAAKGEIILFVDADTIPHMEFFDKIRTICARDHKVVGAGCLIMPRNVNFFESLFFYFLNFIVYLSVQIGRPAIAGSCVAYRRKAFWKVGGFDEEMVASEDQDLCNRIARVGQVIFSPRIVAYTSPRRLRELGFFGLLIDWGKTTFNFLLGIKNKKYRLTHEVQ
ncbi:MAG: glycosyltransferase [Candidatus Micrarchaeota archaeon]|nr:glycosyltransferase [Candidatus Micrarchaeota archaeon]